MIGQTNVTASPLHWYEVVITSEGHPFDPPPGRPWRLLGNVIYMRQRTWDEYKAWAEHDQLIDRLVSGRGAPR